MPMVTQLYSQVCLSPPNPYRRPIPLSVTHIEHFNFPSSLSFLITAFHSCSGLLGRNTTAPTLQLVVFFVPPPHFGVAEHFLLLPLPRAVHAQPAVCFDDAAEGHAGHLEEAVDFI